MNITFAGANNETTGSKHMITIDGINILLDCGMFQGRRWEARKKNENFVFDPKQIDFVILSHAHIDHSGLLPLLVKKGYHGKIYCTKATKDLVSYLLLDSAHIQESDAMYFNSKHHDRESHIFPLYDQVDAHFAIKSLVGVDYEEWIQLTDNIRYKHIEAGHILGSSQIMIEFKENNEIKRLVFSGDLGRWDIPLLRNPQIPDHTDVLIMESTYGNRLHDKYSNALPELSKTINDVVGRGGKIIIPAFALERAQEILYNFAILKDKGDIPDVPVFVDSPLTVNITEIFEKYIDLYDKEAVAFLSKNHNPFHFRNVHYVSSVEESKALNQRTEPCVIISAQGMCEAGRILHHLKNNIGDSKNMVLIVGYQAKNTLGRKLEYGEKEVKIFGDYYKVRAEIKAMHNFSAHGDANDLIRYATSIKGIKNIYLVHGDEDSILSLQDKLQNILTDINIVIPHIGDKY